MTMKRKTLCITAVAAAACAALLGRLLWMGLSEFSPYRTYSQEESLAFFDGATQQWERIVADVAEGQGNVWLTVWERQENRYTDILLADGQAYYRFRMNGPPSGTAPGGVRTSRTVKAHIGGTAGIMTRRPAR